MSTARFLLNLAGYWRGLYLLNCLLWSLVYLGPILPGLILREFFNSLEANTATAQTVLVLLAMFLAIGAGRVVTIYTAIYAAMLHRFGTSGLLRRNMFARILHLPAARALPESAGEVISRFRDDGLYAENAVDWMLDVLGSTVFAVVGFVILATIDLQLTLAVFLPLLAIIGVSRLVSSRVETYRQASRDATEGVTGALGEIFGAVQAIQLNRAEERVIGYLRGLNAVRLRAMVKDRVFSQMLRAVYQNTVSLGTGLVLLLAAGDLRSGELTVGDFALFIYYLAFVTDFVHQVGRFMTINQQTGVSAERMQRIMQGQPPEALVSHMPLYLRDDFDAGVFAEPRERLPLQSIEVEKLTYVHPASSGGIHDVSLSLTPGTLTVITGRIGSGKTTLLRSMLGLLPATAGAVKWNGRPIADPAEFLVSPLVAYVPQVPTLFSFSVVENILLGLPDETELVESSVQAAVCLSMTSPASRRASRLSLGPGE
ncbi:MAG: ATP-binding cassette domain-containing protein [Dehalococcoidia bacterium]|nr:ATP-binding cassette domain-containing protein [Dehalococcoidia bacterium]